MRIPRLPAVRRLACFALAVLATSFASSARAVPDVRLAEILAAPARDWDGSGAFSSRDDEWIEILNGGAEPADLSPYFVTDGDSIPRFRFSGTLAPGAVLLVTGAMAVEWERATGHPIFGLSLGNTGDQVMLWKITGADTALVESYAYKSHESAADRASGRTPDGSVWKLEDGLNPYAGSTQPVGTGCLPTPGVANNCGITPTQKTSWGRVKSIYR
jgi:lamin tail-like protein